MKLKELSAFGFVCSALNNAVYVCPSSEAFVLISQTELLRDRQTDSHTESRRRGGGGGQREEKRERASQPDKLAQMDETNWHRETRQTNKLAQRDETN